MLRKLCDIVIRNQNNAKIAVKHRKNSIAYIKLYEMMVMHSELIRKRIGSSRNIGIFLPNCIDYIIAYFAINYASGIIIPITIQSKKSEIESIVEYCNIKIVITNSQYYDELIDSMQNSCTAFFIYNLDNSMFHKVGKDELNCDKVIPDSSELDDVALMIHTSGSMSNPKRVMLTDENLLSNVESIIKSLGLSRTDKTLIALPMQLASGNTSQLLTHLYLGASIVIMDDVFIPRIFYKLVNDERITNFTAVPSMIIMLLENMNSDRYVIVKS